tara:strand:- start:10208 stop:11272 length:1065 start_codon:yes stop_codon:yes gene_type:complete
MNHPEINDKRNINEFKNITFSKYKKSEAKKELIKCMLSQKIEHACYWSAEIICAGHFLYLWEIIFLFLSKNIHIGNPKLAIYINMRLENFRSILNNGYSDNIIKLRNNKKIRFLFCEVIAILCFSKKKNSFDVPKIKETDFNFFNLTEKLSAKNKRFGYDVFNNEDPNEIFVAINEFAWNISVKIKDNYKAIYWLEWILQYHKLCKKKKQEKKCFRRQYPVDGKYQLNMIWIIWDVLFTEAKKRRNGVVKIIDALKDIFCVKYSSGTNTKRKFIIYNAISLLTESYDLNTPIIKDKEKVEKIKNQIDKIYIQIKKNEIKPDTDYLFNNSINSNVEKTINKLDKLNTLTYIPRNN